MKELRHFSYKKYLLFLVAVLSVNALFAQKEASHWFIPPFDHYTFSSTGPVQQAQTSIRTGMSTASISDSLGNLIFISSDGFIYDRNSRPLPYFKRVETRLDDGNDNTFFVKKPGSSTQYYLFYSGNNFAGNISPWTVKYAIIDLSLNNGNGDVVAANVAVDTTISYGFAIASGNNNSFWIITHKPHTNKFNSWQVSEQGIAASPVVSIAGTNKELNQYYFRELKTSPNGKLIAGITYYYDYTNIFQTDHRFVEVFNFSAKTGSLTSRVRSATEKYVNMYANSHVEFSADNRVLYAAYIYYASGLQPCGYGAGNLWQYNLCYTDSTSFSKYSSLVGNDFSFCKLNIWGQFQLAADRKIYFPYSPAGGMGSINHPNRIGSSAGYSLTNSKISSGGKTYLPTFYHAYTERAVKNNIIYSGGCFPSPTQFQITNDTIGTIKWNFGDPASGLNNISSLAQTSHTFSKPGFFNITADLFNSKGIKIETVTDSVEIKDPTKKLLTDLPRDTTVCEGVRFSSKLKVLNGIFHWSVRRDNNILDIGTRDSAVIGEYGEGTYIVEMRQNDCDGCVLIDSIHMRVLRKPYVDLGGDRDFCTGDSLQLYTYNPASVTRWSTGDTTPIIWAKKPGIYSVKSEFDKNGCISIDTIIVKEKPGVTFRLPADTTLCNDTKLTLKPGVKQAYYYWQDYSGLDSFVVSEAGKYWVNASNSYGCSASDTINVAYVNAANISLGADTTLCSGTSLELSVNTRGATYRWNTGSTGDKITVTTTGSYRVRVDNGTCALEDTINVTFKDPPRINIGKDTVLCERDELHLDVTTINSNYKWQDGSSEAKFNINASGKYWVEVNQQGCAASDTINVSYKASPNPYIGTDTSLCERATLQLNAEGIGNASYKWQDNSISPQFTVTHEGNYFVEVTASNGCKNTDTIEVKYHHFPLFTLGNDTTLCEMQTLPLHVDLANASYKWQDGSTSNNYLIRFPGTYAVTVTKNGCSKTDSIAIDYRAKPAVHLGKDTSLCKGTALALSAYNEGAKYRWQDNSSFAEYLVTKPGSYDVSVSLNGCVESDTIKVGFKDKPAFSLGNDTSLCLGQQIVLRVDEVNGTYTWQNGSGTNRFIVTTPGTYSLNVTNNCGTSFDAINITEGSCLLAMPSAFTPNGDGRNDIFRIPQGVSTTLKEFSVFDRTGNRIFSTRDIRKGWDGKNKGMVLNSDTFVYIISGSNSDGNVFIKGTIVLLH